MNDEIYDSFYSRHIHWIHNRMDDQSQHQRIHARKNWMQKKERTADRFLRGEK